MDDLISEFITETEESLSMLDLELVKLEQNPNDKEILGNIFRLVHTIKGTCGFLGLPRLESVAHAGENVLGKFRDDTLEVTPKGISMVLEALDTIKGIMDHLAQHGEEPEGDDTDLTTRLNNHADGKDGDEDAPSVSSPAIAEAPAAPPQTPPAADDSGMKLPETEGGLSVDVLAELERIFAETAPTIDGGEAPSAYVEAEEEPSKPEAVEALPEVVEEKISDAPVKKNFSKQAKEAAVKQGLAVDAKQPSDAGAAGATQSIRVNLDVLENLMQMVGELVLTRNQLLQIVRNREDDEFRGPLQHLSHITTELQEGVMKTRMQPIGNAWAKFPRLIRDLSIELGKKIELRMHGAETELDRQLLELIKDPLTHMVRNSCDHGLETIEGRIEAGKDETGIVTLSAYHEGGHIIIEISDDGRGVNIEKVKQKALENGITTQDELAQLGDQQIMQYIFKPGFSTAEKVTSVSGRGVGMDVVRTNIEKIGGTVELGSVTGKGSIFHIKIPLTLAIVSVLIVESANERFAIPQINVVELVRAGEDSEHRIETIHASPVLRLRGKLLPLVALDEALGLPPAHKGLGEEGEEGERAEEEEFYIVVCKVGGSEFGLIIDRVHDTEEIVVKPCSSLLSHINVYSGNTILGDGSVIMILDPNGLARLSGEIDGSAKEENASEGRLKGPAERKVSFLTFRSGAGSPKAVPLELVSRLEEIKVENIEYSGDRPVIQYRGDLMRLVNLPASSLPTEGMCEVIVFTYDNRTIGLVVDEILDIIQAPLAIKLGAKTSEYLGSMVIAGKTMDVVDVGYLLRDLVEEATQEGRFGKSFSAHRVLLVEDSMFFRKLTVPFLQEVGYDVTACGLAKEALKVLEVKEFDAIVTDIEMPEMDGFAFTERLRMDSRYDHIPIIAFTSTVNKQFIERGEEVGMNDLILKTNREALIKSIAKSLALDEEAA